MPLIVVAAAIYVVIAVVHGTSAAGTDPADKWGCGAARPTISPSAAMRGQTITVAAGSAHCAKSLPDGTKFDISVSSRDSSDARVSGQASVHHDGSFTVTLTIPSDFPVGEAAVVVNDADYVPCHDVVEVGAGTPEGMALVSCAASTTAFEVVG